MGLQRGVLASPLACKPTPNPVLGAEAGDKCLVKYGSFSERQGGETVNRHCRAPKLAEPRPPGRGPINSARPDLTRPFVWWPGN